MAEMISTSALFETDPLLGGLRTTPFWFCAGGSTVVYGYWSTKTRNIRLPLMAGFALFTAGIGTLSSSCRWTALKRDSRDGNRTA